jgi:hypothetical protein
MLSSSRRYAIAGLFALGALAAAPSAALADPLYVGNWTVSASDGTTFPMTLFTASGQIVGVYDQAGRVGIITNGQINGDELDFNWKLTGTLKGNGTALFHLDTANKLSGTWEWSNGMGSGTWSAIRKP